MERNCRLLDKPYFKLSHVALLNTNIYTPTPRVPLSHLYETMRVCSFKSCVKFGAFQFAKNKLRVLSTSDIYLPVPTPVLRRQGRVKVLSSTQFPGHQARLLSF